MEVSHGYTWYAANREWTRGSLAFQGSSLKSGLDVRK